MASALILAAAPAQYLGRQHDDILFVIASHALSDGRYSLFISPDRPPLVHVWPGFPALLLPVTWAAGEWPPAYQLFCAAILAACPWAIWLWLRRRESHATAVLIALLFASSPLALSQAGCVMPEAPYLLLSMLLLAALEAARPSSRVLGWLLLAAVQIRPAGLSLVPAVLVRAARERRWADAARRLAPAAAGCLLWYGWCYRQSGFIQEGREWAVSYEGRGMLGLIALPLSNARFFLAALGSSFLPPSFDSGNVALLLGGLVAGAAAAGVARELRAPRANANDARGTAGVENGSPRVRRFDAPVLALIVGVGMHLFWGWQYERYWIPLLPITLWAAATGLKGRAPAVLGALLGAQLLFQTPQFLRASPHATPELRDTYSWLRERMEPADVLASALYARDGFYTERPSVPLAAAPDAREFSRLLKSRRVRFVLWQDLEIGLSLDATAPVRRQLGGARAQLSDPAFFRPVHEDPAARAVVFEVLR